MSRETKNADVRKKSTKILPSPMPHVHHPPSEIIQQSTHYTVSDQNNSPSSFHKEGSKSQNSKSQKSNNISSFHVQRRKSSLDPLNQERSSSVLSLQSIESKIGADMKGNISRSHLGTNSEIQIPCRNAEYKYSRERVTSPINFFSSSIYSTPSDEKQVSATIPHDQLLEYRGRLEMKPHNEDGDAYLGNFRHSQKKTHPNSVGNDFLCDISNKKKQNAMSPQRSIASLQPKRSKLRDRLRAVLERDLENTPKHEIEVVKQRKKRKHKIKHEHTPRNKISVPDLEHSFEKLNSSSIVSKRSELEYSTPLKSEITKSHYQKSNDTIEESVSNQKKLAPLKSTQSKPPTIKKLEEHLNIEIDMNSISNSSNQSSSPITMKQLNKRHSARKSSKKLAPLAKISHPKEAIRSFTSVSTINPIFDSPIGHIGFEGRHGLQNIPNSQKLQRLNSEFSIECNSARRSVSSLAVLGGRRRKTLPGMDSHLYNLKSSPVHIFQTQTSELLQLYEELHLKDTEYATKFRSSFFNSSSKSSIEAISKELEAMKKLKDLILELDQFIHTRELQVEILHRLVRSYDINQYKEYSFQTMQRRARQICIRLSQSEIKIRSQLKKMQDFSYIIPIYMWNGEVNYQEKMELDLQFFRNSELYKIVSNSLTLDPFNRKAHRKRKSKNWINKSLEDHTDSNIVTDATDTSNLNDYSSFEPSNESFQEVSELDTTEILLASSPIQTNRNEIQDLDIKNNPSRSVNSLQLEDSEVRFSYNSRDFDDNRNEAMKQLLQLLESIENRDAISPSTDLLINNLITKISPIKNIQTIDTISNNQNAQLVPDQSSLRKNSENIEIVVDEPKASLSSPNTDIDSKLKKDIFHEMVKSYYKLYYERKKKRSSISPESSPNRIKKSLHDGKTGIVLSYFSHNDIDDFYKDPPLSILTQWWKERIEVFQRILLPLFRSYKVRKYQRLQNESAEKIQKFWKAYQEKCQVYIHYVQSSSTDGHTLRRIRCNLRRFERENQVRQQRKETLHQLNQEILIARGEQIHMDALESFSSNKERASVVIQKNWRAYKTRRYVEALVMQQNTTIIL